jgi:hypothetical protein
MKALLVALLLTPVALAQEAARDERLRVTLSLPAEYDPVQPGDARLTVEVANVSSDTIPIAGASWTGGPAAPCPSSLVHGHGVTHRFGSFLDTRRESPAPPALGPGERRVALDLPIAVALPPRFVEGEVWREREWYWHWPARPEPPESPIARWRQPGYEAEASLQARLITDRGEARSDEVVVRVVQR